MNYFRIALGLVIVVAGCGWCVDSNAKNAPELSVRVTSDCAEYGLMDEVIIHVEIENRGPSPIVMYGKIGWGELGGLTLKVAEENGVSVQPPSLDDDMVIPSTLRDKNYYVTVFKNQFIGVSRSGHAAEFFPGVGKYKMWVEYMSPVPEGSSLVKQSFWSMEHGKIISNVLILTVGERTSCGR